MSPHRAAVPIYDALRSEQLAQPATVADAYGAIVRSLVKVIAAHNRQIDELEELLTDHFGQHPDADILRSLPGLGAVTGARVLGDFGDEPTRYATPKDRKNYAGTSPLTVASGTRRVVRARHIRNRRLADALYWWAFNATLRSPGAARSTTSDELLATPTLAPSASSATASSASSTAASAPAPSTTKTSPGATGKISPLDPATRGVSDPTYRPGPSSLLPELP